MHKGSCLCGTIAFEFDTEPSSYGVCQCKSCQKASGSAFGANISIEGQDFRIVSGENSIKEYESSPGKKRCFCFNCGSPLFARVGNDYSTYRVRLGSLDTEFHKSPACHYFASHGAPWYSAFDQLQKFDEWPDGKVLARQNSKQDNNA